MRIISAAIATLLAATAGAAAAAQDIKLGIPGYGGTGCPAGTVSATLSPDARQLSLIFDEYIVEAGGSTGRAFDRKSCNIAIPVRVPQGYSVSVFKIDYRGYNNLPVGAASQFNVEYFFAGMRGPTFRRVFNGRLDRDYLISNQLTADAAVWSPCGAEVNLRTNSNMRVTTQANRQAMSTVDSADVDAAIIYHIQWRRCQ
jgi:hypothetical protein